MSKSSYTCVKSRLRVTRINTWITEHNLFSVSDGHFHTNTEEVMMLTTTGINRACNDPTILKNSLSVSDSLILNECRFPIFRLLFLLIWEGCYNLS